MTEKKNKIIEEQAALFSVLGDPTRLKLLKLLSQQREPDALCVNALVGLLGVSQPAISQHLRVLKSVGLVKGERRGYHIHYFVNRKILEHCQELVSALLNLRELTEEKSCQEYCPDRREENVSPN